MQSVQYTVLFLKVRHLFRDATQRMKYLSTLSIIVVSGTLNYKQPWYFAKKKNSVFTLRSGHSANMFCSYLWKSSLRLSTDLDNILYPHWPIVSGSTVSHKAILREMEKLISVRPAAGRRGAGRPPVVSSCLCSGPWCPAGPPGPRCSSCASCSSSSCCGTPHPRVGASTHQWGSVTKKHKVAKIQ